MSYDPACKLLFAHPRMAEDLLRRFVARRRSHALDFATLELRPAASVSDDLRRREGGSGVLVSLHDAFRLIAGNPGLGHIREAVAPQPC